MGYPSLVGAVSVGVPRAMLVGRRNRAVHVAFATALLDLDLDCRVGDPKFVLQHLGHRLLDPLALQGALLADEDVAATRRPP